MRLKLAAVALTLTLLAGIALAAGGVLHGNIKSKVFHRAGCRYYNCKNCIVPFNTRDEAIKAGYRPCKICQP